MNLHRSSSVTHSASKSGSGNRATQQSTHNVRQDRAGDQQHFQKLLNDLKRDDSQSDKPDNEAETSSSANRDEALEDIKSILKGKAGEDTTAFMDDDDLAFLSISSDNEGSRAEQSDMEYTGAGAELSAMVLTAFSPGTQIQGAHSGGVESGSIGSLPVNEAAERIIEQMQSRARRREARRWQFSLPGLLGSAVEVTIECSDNQSWIVQLSTADDCTDEERLALQQRLAERMDDVSVVLVCA